MDAFNTASKDLEGIRKGMEQRRAILDLLPTIQAGPGLAKELARKYTDMWGGDAAANQQTVNQLISSSTIEGLSQFKGYGQIRNPEIELLKKSTGSLNQDPRQFKMNLEYQDKLAQRKIDLDYAWANASPAEQAKGYRAFETKFERETPFPKFDTSELTGKKPAPAASGTTSNNIPWSKVD
jgi:hypothetical protein